MKRRPLHFRLLQLHRWTGLFAAILVLLLSITGIALEHTEDLSLDEHFITSQWLLSSYGIEPDPIKHYAMENSTVAHAGDYLYLNGQPLDGLTAQTLCGALALEHSYVVCTDEGIYLLDKQGQLIEQLTPDLSIPAYPTGLGLTSSRQVVLLSHDGNWLGDSDFLLWQPYDSQPSIVSHSSQAESALKYQVQAHNISHEISYERILLDLHSGRLFGSIGPWLMDLAALAMIYLALSGVWVWWKRQRR